ncbi:MAG: hypothetical protein AB1489_13865 [Acidobacteriota bacterium]
MNSKDPQDNKEIDKQESDLSKDNRYYFETVDIDNTKLELERSQLKHQDQEQQSLAVIIKVAQPGYVPAGVVVRAWISDDLFTAQMQLSDKDRIEQDSMVISVSPAERLRSS